MKLKKSFGPDPSTHISGNKNAGDSEQGLLGPGKEPIDIGVIDHSREVSTPSSQRIPYRRHGQHHVKIVGAFVYVVLPDTFLAVLTPIL